MAINPNPAYGAGDVPEFTLGDRLRKAREVSGMEMQDLAALIDIHRQSVARYEQGIAVPKQHVLLSWSMVTGIDLQWIVSGVPRSTQVDQSTRTTDSVDREDSAYRSRGIPRLFKLIQREEVSV